MTEEIIIDEQDTTEKYKNKEIDCLHFCCKKGDRGSVLFWCEFYDDYCDNYNGCYYRKYLRLEQENKELKNIIKIHDCTKYDYYKLMKENEEWHIKYAGCNTANSAIQEQNKQYRSALEDIKEIAEKYKDMEGCKIPLRAILTLIDEVL